MATRMAHLGIAPHVIEAIRNHVSGHKHGMHGIYNRADYTVQKRHAICQTSAKICTHNLKPITLSVHLFQHRAEQFPCRLS